MHTNNSLKTYKIEVYCIFLFKVAKATIQAVYNIVIER